MSTSSQATMSVALPPGFSKPENCADRINAWHDLDTADSVFAWHDACCNAKVPGFAASKPELRVAYLEKRVAYLEKQIAEMKQLDRSKSATP